MADKDKVYKRIKISGLLMFIPFILAAGPLSGWVIGDFLTNKLSLSIYFTYICILVGVAVSIREVVRIIRMVLKIESRGT